MKRPLFFLLIFLVINYIFYFAVFRPQKDREPLGLVTQEAMRRLDGCGLIPAGRQFIQSDFVRQLASIDRSLLLSTSGRQIAKRILRPPRPINPLELIPQNAMLIMDINDAAAASRTFLRSRLGQALTSINWPSIMDRLSVKKRFRNQLGKNTSNILKLLKSPLATQLPFKRVVLAHLPVQPALFQDNIRQALLENLLVLIPSGQNDDRSSLPAPLNLIDLILREKSAGSTFNYHGISIKTLTLTHNKKLYIAPVGQQIALSFGLKPVQQSIDLFIKRILRQEVGFLRNKDYTRIKKRGFSENDFLLYADLFQLKFHIKLLSNLSGQQKGKKAPETQHRVSGVRSMGFFYRTEKNTGLFRTVTHFSPDLLRPFQKKIYTRVPILNRGFGEMPADLLIYFWCNWLEPRVWWQTTIAQGKKGELAAAERISAWIKEQTGMSMDSFLSLFGQEFGFNVAEISTAGFFPVPRICFIIEVLDKSKVEQFFKKIISGLPVRQDKVAGISVVSLMLANGMMQPSYAFTDDRLLLADSREQIEDIILNRKEPLVQDTTFQAVDTGMTKPANLTLFARTAELVNSMKELASWAGTMIAVRDHTTGEKTKILVDQVISPLLDGFKMYQAIGLRSYTGPGELIVDAAVLRAEPENGASEASASKKSPINE
jgi:hypothetical protein